MSGGLYGRGKAPERACMKLTLWPDADRGVWRQALLPFDPFDPEGGDRATYSPVSNAKLEKGYGRWLTFLSIAYDLEGAPALRITKKRVLAYAEALADLGNSRASILSRLQELLEMATLHAPGHDWAFIKRIAARIRSRPGKVRGKVHKLAASGDLLDLGLSLMESATQQATPRLRALDYRDGLMIALLSLRPLRRTNLAGLTLHSSLIELGGAWSIHILAAETKNRTAIDLPWPALLQDHLGVYLRVHRPILMTLKSRWASPIGDALWVSSHGSPMTGMAAYDQIRKRTRAHLGKAINPHMFRDAAATTMAIADPAHVRLASTLLGHRSTATTERHYQQAQSLTAHRRYLLGLANLLGLSKNDKLPADASCWEP